ncbi:hypothetical protein B0H16DRAFT_1848564 [Mycena metata]|uniref:Uncharacterized protein n=1 Tax=Mycena metata TaxID=1033252 RepID=A0AAD7N7H3_9AGAR|nr:hypothetical protein B0H16DRAFT_1848564 [Mycena metata]
MPYHDILRRLFFGLLLSVTCVQALGVLYPIYWNPDTTCTAFNSSTTPTPVGGSPTGQMVAYISHARSQNFTFIALNAGGAADAAYFPLTDMINTYESSYASFKTSQLMNTDSTPPSKQAVTLFETPSTGSYLSVLTELADLGVAAVYIANATEYGVRGVPPPFAALLPEIKDLQVCRKTDELVFYRFPAQRQLNFYRFDVERIIHWLISRLYGYSFSAFW